MPEFSYTDLLPAGPDSTDYRLVTADGITARRSLGRDFVEVEPGVLTRLAAAAMRDIAHLLRPGHLRQLRSVLDDPEASGNDRFVARQLLQNACIAAGGVLPMCQDTGTAKYASARYLDTLPAAGSPAGHGFRDLELEQRILELTRRTGIGAQFGGKYFCHDVRVIRLPRHGASCPAAIAVSCSADRQALGKITRDGAFLERLETDPAQYLPEITADELVGDVTAVDLSRPMAQIRAEMSKYPVRTRLSLTGPMVVARDIAHAKIAERLAAGEPMPGYLRDHPVYYAGPAKTPEGYASGSFGPTTAGRMDSYVPAFQAAGGSLVMLAKGNRSAAVTAACKQHGGFYLGSIGGAAAKLAQDCITKVEALEYPELGMEAVWRIEVRDFPAFIVVDDKGNDFFADVTGPASPLLTIGSAPS
jgi:fumarate hydratase, class I